MWSGVERKRAILSGTTPIRPMWDVEVRLPGLDIEVSFDNSALSSSGGVK